MHVAKRYRTERRTIDPRTVSTVLHDEAAVEHYRRNPHSSYGFWGNGGRPSVGRGSGGRTVAWEGNHRIEAAVREGRRIDVDYQVEIGGPDDKPKKSFWSW